MILSVAWKNIWRNKQRSSVVCFAVVIGLMAGSFAVALMEGMSKARAKSQIFNEISHIQIHHPKFKENQEIKYYIENFDQIKSFISQMPQYIASTGRTAIPAMLNTSGGNTGAFVYGINPDEEKKVTEIYKFVKDSTGTYFTENRKNLVLISETLAKKLKLDRYKVTENTAELLLQSGFPENEITKLKQIYNIEYRTHKDYFNALRNIYETAFVDEFEFLFLKYAIEFKERASIVITFQDINGKITGDKFKITGIYKTGNRMFDETAVFVNKNDLAHLSGLKKSDVHEIAVIINNRDAAKSFAEKIKLQFPELSVLSWGEIDPMLVMLAEYMGIYNYFLIAVILAALAFGIINTMLMAIMERTKELGMLAAVGMNRKKIFLMIMLETIFLTITGAIVGLIGNYFIIAYFSKNGIDLTKHMGEAFEAIGFESVVYPELGINYYIGFTLLVIFTAILSSVYPAYKAVKLNPAEAVRTDA